MEQVELSKEKKVQAEARISEVMLKNAHGKIELKYGNGKVLYTVETQKLKL